MSPLSIFD